ncbi:MAG: hypothetical protein DRH12_14040 [Deltaproteobacteria bacterium]|nr:MAG: hypothetical protein DRH12_14040 [Deltaproteobacteria bacterium]
MKWWERLLPLGTVGLAFVLRVWGLGTQGLWADEIATVMFAERPTVPDQLKWLLNARNQPPGYHLTMRAWLWPGHQEFWVRVPSVLWATLAVAVIYALGRRMAGRRVGALAAFLLATSPLHVWHSQNARMYPMLVTLALLSNLFLVRLAKRERWCDWLGYFVCSVAAMWTNFSAPFVILAQMVYLVFTRRRYMKLVQHWFVCMVAMGLAFSPWAIAIFLNGGLHKAGIWWIPPARPFEPLVTWYSFVMGPAGAPDAFYGLFLVGGLTALALLFYAAWATRRESALLTLWLALPAIMVMLISLDLPIPQKRSAYLDRFLLATLPPLLLLIAWGMVRLVQHRRRLGELVCTLVCVPMLVSLARPYLDTRFRRDDWRGVLEYINAHAKPGDRLLMHAGDVHVLYYYRARKDLLDTLVMIDAPSSTGKSNADAESGWHTETQKASRVWFPVYVVPIQTHLWLEHRYADPVGRAMEDEAKQWMDARYQPVEEHEFTGIYLSLYEPGANSQREHTR